MKAHKVAPGNSVKPIDGISLLPYLGGTTEARNRPIAFEFQDQLALIDDRFKLYSKDGGETFELYDVPEDPAETKDLASAHPGVVERMRMQLKDWQRSCLTSLEGADY